MFGEQKALQPFLVCLLFVDVGLVVLQENQKETTQKRGSPILRKEYPMRVAKSRETKEAKQRAKLWVGLQETWLQCLCRRIPCRRIHSLKNHGSLQMELSPLLGASMQLPGKRVDCSKGLSLGRPRVCRMWTSGPKEVQNSNWHVSKTTTKKDFGFQKRPAQPP